MIVCPTYYVCRWTYRQDTTELCRSEQLTNNVDHPHEIVFVSQQLSAYITPVPITLFAGGEKLTHFDGHLSYL